MKELIQEFNEDIANAETTQFLDPLTLAAKYCNDFVMIHPFLWEWQDVSVDSECYIA